MGTAARIVLYAPDDEEADRGARAAFEEIARIEACISDYDPESELSRLREGEQVVSEKLFEVLAAARHFSEITGGAFDVTVGPVVALWRRGVPPDQAEREAALESVGWRNLVLDPSRRTVRLAKPGMRLDPGGIGKGYAADEALSLLARQGVRRALVDLGGDLALGDPPPGRSGWRVEIEGEEGRREILLSNCGVAASGDTERFVEAGGRRYSHILDPRTGIGVEHGRRVSVVAPDCTTADALATALSVLSPEEGALLVASLPGVSSY
jgi:thiamine biosynthesis lipoprotein